MALQLECCTESIIQVVDAKEATRDDVAVVYALALRSDAECDWPKVNRAIIARWSHSALGYIKKKAWKLAEGR